MDIKLEDEEEDDLLHMEVDAFQTDGKEELEENLKDIMKDLNILPKTCEVPQLTVFPVASDSEARNIKKMTIATQMLKQAGELRKKNQKKAMTMIENVVKDNPTMAGLQAIIAPAVRQAVSLQGKIQPGPSKPAACSNPPQILDINPIIKPSFKKDALNGQGSYYCTACDFHSKYWKATDKHMHIEHFKLKYGPCPFCNDFTTWSKELWRKHLKTRCIFVSK